MSLPESSHDLGGELFAGEPAPESPRHGFQGDRLPYRETEQVPASLTIAVSREAGSRGGTIARRAAKKLGWQVYNQELLEYIAQEGAFREGVAGGTAPSVARWVEDRLQRLLREQNLSQHPGILELARLVLTLGAEGNVVLIGRGAGHILPPETTLNVRIVAPEADRVAYMSQWLRLTTERAAEQVRLRDSGRAEFVTTHFHRQPDDIYQYDLLLNSSLLGEDRCTELIVQAAKAKATSFVRSQ